MASVLPIAPPLAPADPDPSFAELLAGRPHLSMHVLDGLLVEGVPLARIAITPDSLKYSI